MRIEESCGGWAVHWPAPAGQSLQGWYETEDRARGAAALCQASLDAGGKVPKADRAG